MYILSLIRVSRIIRHVIVRQPQHIHALLYENIPRVFNGYFPLVLHAHFRYETVGKLLYIPKPSFCIVIDPWIPFT